MNSMLFNLTTMNPDRDVISCRKSPFEYIYTRLFPRLRHSCNGHVTHPPLNSERLQVSKTCTQVKLDNRGPVLTALITERNSTGLRSRS